MSAQLMARQKSSNQTTSKRGKLATHWLQSDPSPTVSDPIFSCVNQDVSQLSDSIVVADFADSVTNFSNESDHWIKLIEFGLSTHHLDKNTARALESAIHSNGTFNRDLIGCANTIMDSLESSFKQSELAIQTAFEHAHISLKPDLVSWVKQQFCPYMSYESKFEEEYCDVSLDEWGLRLMGDCGTACYSIDALLSAPYELKVIGGALLNVICNYGGKVTSNNIRKMACTYNYMDELEDCISIEQRKAFLALANSDNVQLSELTKMLNTFDYDLEYLTELLIDDEQSAIDRVVEFLNYLEDLHFFEDGWADTLEYHRPYKFLLTIKTQFDDIDLDNKVVVNHPFYSHLKTLLDISLSIFKGNDRLDDHSILGSEVDFDLVWMVSVHPNDHEYISDAHQYCMETSETPVRTINFDNPKGLINAFHNFICANYLIVAFDAFG